MRKTIIIPELNTASINIINLRIVTFPVKTGK